MVAPSPGLHAEMASLRVLGVAAALLAVPSLAVVSVTNVVPGDGATILIQHDCHGTLSLLPSMPALSAQINTYDFFNTIYHNVNQAVQSRARCHCPALTAANARDMYGLSFGNFVKSVQCAPTFTRNQFEQTCGLDDNTATSFSLGGWPFINGQQNGGGDAVLPDANSMATTGGDASASPVNPNPNWTPDGGDAECWTTNVPSTCQASSFTVGGAGQCSFQMGGPGLRDGEQIQVAIKQCSQGGRGNMKLPFFTIGCSGPLCENILKPCSRDSDCGSGTRLTCDDPIDIFDDTTDQTLADLLTELVTNLAQYDTGSCSFRPGDDMQRQVFALIGAMYGVSNGASRSRLCIGLDEWDTFGDELSQENAFFMSPWDGSLNNGSNVFNHFTLANTATPAIPASATCLPQVNAGLVTPLIEYTCGGTLHFLPTSNLRASGSFNLFNNLFINVVGPWMQTLADSCTWRTSVGVEPAGQPALFGYLVYGPMFWMRMFVAPASTAPNRVTWADGYDVGDAGGNVYLLLQQLFEITPETLLFSSPWTCSRDRFATDGMCQFQTPAVGDILGLDITLRFTLANCGNGNIAGAGLPYFNVDCVGESGAGDCDLLSEAWNIKTCNPGEANSICDRNSRGQVTARAGRLPCSPVANNIATEDGRLGIIGSILWGNGVSNNQGQAVDPCSNANTTWNIIRNIANQLSGQPTVPSLDAPLAGVCQPIWEIQGVDSDAFERWVDGSLPAVLNRYGRPIYFVTNSSLPSDGTVGLEPNTDAQSPPNVVGLRDMHPFAPIGTGGCRNGFSETASDASAATAAFVAAQTAAQSHNGGFQLPGITPNVQVAGLVVNQNGCTANCTYGAGQTTTSTSVPPGAAADIEGFTNPTAAQQQQMSSPNELPGSQSPNSQISGGDSGGDSGLSGGAIAAIVIVLFLLFGAGLAAAFVLGKKKGASSVVTRKPLDSINEAYEDDAQEDEFTEADIGAQVSIKGYACNGTIRFVGVMGGDPKFRIGIELDEPLGKNNGSNQGTQYFECEQDHGIFVLPPKVSLL